MKTIGIIILGASIASGSLLAWTSANSHAKNISKKTNSAKQNMHDQVAKLLQDVDTKISNHQWLLADAVLAQVEALENVKHPAQSSVLLPKAQVSLYTADYASARKNLGIFFEGDGVVPRKVSGANHARAWYWYLVSETGNRAKAEEIKGQLFAERCVVPDSNDHFDPRSFSKKPLAQVYLYLAAFKWWTTCPTESTKYFDLAVKEDPSGRLPKGFKEGINKYRGLKGDASVDFPVLDATAIQQGQAKHSSNTRS